MRILHASAMAAAAMMLAVMAGSAGVTTATPGGQNPTDADADTSRVIAIGGSVTEIVYALGLQDRLVAVDTTSVHPSDALETKPNVGYMRALSAEGVLSLNPTMILALEGAGPPNVIEVLKKASVSFVSVADDPTAEGVSAKIRFVAKVLGAADRGEALAQRIDGEFEKLTKALSGVSSRKKVLFVLSLANGRPLVSGVDTPAHGILQLAAADNAITQFDGFRPASDEAIIAGAPDAILMMRRVSASASPEQVFSLAALAATPAARSNNLIAMRGQYLLGFGPRTAHAAWDLANRLYPEQDLPVLESPDADTK